MIITQASSTSVLSWFSISNHPHCHHQGHHFRLHSHRNPQRLHHHRHYNQVITVVIDTARRVNNTSALNNSFNLSILCFVLYFSSAIVTTCAIARISCSSDQCRRNHIYHSHHHYHHYSCFHHRHHYSCQSRYRRNCQDHDHHGHHDHSCNRFPHFGINLDINIMFNIIALLVCVIGLIENTCQQRLSS